MSNKTCVLGLTPKVAHPKEKQNCSHVGLPFRHTKFPQRTETLKIISSGDGWTVDALCCISKKVGDDCPAASQRKPAAKRRGSATKHKYRPTIIGLTHSLWYRYNPRVHAGLRQFVELLIFLPASGNAEATIRDNDDVWAVCSKGLEEKALDVPHWDTSSLSLRSSMHGNCTQDRCTRYDVLTGHSSLVHNDLVDRTVLSPQ